MYFFFQNLFKFCYPFINSMNSFDCSFFKTDFLQSSQYKIHIIPIQLQLWSRLSKNLLFQLWIIQNFNIPHIWPIQLIHFSPIKMKPLILLLQLFRPSDKSIAHYRNRIEAVYLLGQVWVEDKSDTFFGF